MENRSSPTPKIFAIGDIHGCHSKLTTLLARISYDKDIDTLIFLGDYINRGPDSNRVLETLLEVKASCAHTVFLKGNHEQALLEYAATGDVDSLHALRMMGVEATVTSYRASVRGLRDLSCFPQEHRDFLSSLGFFHIAGNYLFTHADVNDEMLALAKNRPSLPAIEEHIEARLLSSRRLTLEKSIIDRYIVVFGHSPFATPMVMPHRICIDTGAVFGNLLTALELPAFRFHHS